MVERHGVGLDVEPEDVVAEFFVVRVEVAYVWPGPLGEGEGADEVVDSYPFSLFESCLVVLMVVVLNSDDGVPARICEQV